MFDHDHQPKISHFVSVQYKLKQISPQKNKKAAGVKFYITVLITSLAFEQSTTILTFLVISYQGLGNGLTDSCEKKKNACYNFQPWALNTQQQKDVLVNPSQKYTIQQQLPISKPLTLLNVNARSYQNFTNTCIMRSVQKIYTWSLYTLCVRLDIINLHRMKFKSSLVYNKKILWLLYQFWFKIVKNKFDVYIHFFHIIIKDKG